MARRGLMGQVGGLLAGISVAVLITGYALPMWPRFQPSGVQVAASGERASFVGRSASRVRLYAGTLSSWKLTELEPKSLAIMRHGHPIAIRDSHLSSASTVILSSQNGLILVADSVQRASHIIRVINGRTGALRSQFRSTVPTSLFAVTADGSRLVGYRSPYGGDWDVLSGKNGRLLRSIPDAQAMDGLTLLDPAGRFLYALHATWGIDQKAPTSPTLVAYDLTTGKEAGHLALHGIVAGSWSSGRTVQGDPVLTDWEPGLAISPDGRQLAVLDGHSGMVTLIDARSLTVERTVPLTVPESAPARLLSWLGLEPEIASAKQIEGGMRTVQFSANGQRLYVTGVDYTVDERGHAAAHAIGLQMIDVNRGEILAKSLQGRQVSWVGAAPDGEGVYSLTGGTGSTAGRYTLRRQDPATLRITATRTFRALPEIFVTARSAG